MRGLIKPRRQYHYEIVKLNGWRGVKPNGDLALVRTAGSCFISHA